MNEALKIQERLKDIATELGAYTDAEEALTEEQVNHCEALQVEANELTVQLSELRQKQQKADLQAKADEIRGFAKNGTRVTAPTQPGTRIGRTRDSVLDDPKRGFKSLAHFAARVFDAGNNVRGDELLMQAAAGTGMTQGVNSEGGVLIPPAFSKTIWDGVMVRSNSLLSYCDQIPVDQGVESVTVPAINETSRADGSRMGGIRGYWKGELTALTESRPAFREIKLTPHELFVFAYVSDKLLRNSPMTASRIIEQGAADEISFKIGDAIINGTGSGQPRGVLTAPATLSISKETGQAAATIQVENLRKMYARMHVNYMDGAVWFVNQDTFTQMDNLQFPVGTGGIPVYLPPGGVSQSPYRTLYGKPVVPIEYCATLGTVGDVIFANLRAYAAAVKGMADAAYSMHLKFDYAQTAYRLIFEMDGQPWLNSPITPFKGTNTTSAFITLATRS